MTGDGSDEVVFTVEGARATPAQRIGLGEAGLTERGHLQEWVIAHPKILGPDVMVVTFEFDQWSSAGTAPRDRLDVLGLGRDGRLVVAELKRGRAPDPVDMQAIKYAAMASRFSEDTLSEQHARSWNARHPDELISETQAGEKLRTHSDVGLTQELLAQPRIVLLAEDFPATVTATAVWLNEMGLDLTLMRYVAYRTQEDATILTVSQLYPVAEIGAFEVAPRSRAGRVRSEEAPQVPWTEADLAVLASLANATTLAVMEVCSERPDEWVVASDIHARAGVSRESAAGQLGGFGLTSRSRFGRSNPPFEREWAIGGMPQAYYRVTSETAEKWRSALAHSSPDGSSVQPASGFLEG